MHRDLHFPFVVFILVALPASLAAQITRDPVSQNEPVQKVAPLPSNVNPEDIQKPDPSVGEKKQKTYIAAPDQTKRLSPKNENSGAQQKQGSPVTTTDKYGNPLPDLNQRDKAQNNIPAATEKTTYDTDLPLSDGITYPDLQVTATPESPQTQVFQGSERLPKPVAEKTETPAPVEKISAPDTNSTSTIGKVSFLKQYVSELKAQIEKNKKNANYPLAEKQQELLQLENLLKGE